MTARTWMLILGIGSSAVLAVGIPVLAVASATEVVRGPIASVDPGAGVIVLRDVSGPPSIQGRTVAVHLRPGQPIVLTDGIEDLALLVPGQEVEARISRRPGHQARWVRLQDRAGQDRAGQDRAGRD